MVNFNDQPAPQAFGEREKGSLKPQDPEPGSFCGYGTPTEDGSRAIVRCGRNGQPVSTDVRVHIRD